MATAAHLQEWTGENATVAQIEEAIGSLRRECCDDTGVPDMRTSVMTHIAWVPPEWHGIAWKTLEGMAERHPSRAIVLVPGGTSGEDDLCARVQVVAYPLAGERRHVAAEIIELRLGRRRAQSPASIVMPLLITGLPVFSRWRGRPAFGGRELQELTSLVDRFIVDSREWDDPAAEYPRLAELFEETAVSDIAWRRTLPWRLELARGWPSVADCEELGVNGPAADAHLLAGWLRSRLKREISLTVEPTEEVESVAVDGRTLPEPREELPDSSALLSAELETFSRERVYEAAVRAA